MTTRDSTEGRASSTVIGAHSAFQGLSRRAALTGALGVAGLGALAACAPAAPSSAPAAAPTTAAAAAEAEVSAKLIGIHKKGHELWNARDLETFIPTFAPSIYYMEVAKAKEITNPEEMIEFASKWFKAAPDAQLSGVFFYCGKVADQLGNAPASLNSAVAGDLLHRVPVHPVGHPNRTPPGRAAAHEQAVHHGAHRIYYVSRKPPGRGQPRPAVAGNGRRNVLRPPHPGKSAWPYRRGRPRGPDERLISSGDQQMKNDADRRDVVPAVALLVGACVFSRWWMAQGTLMATRTPLMATMWARTPKRGDPPRGGRRQSSGVIPPWRRRCGRRDVVSTLASPELCAPAR